MIKFFTLVIFLLTFVNSQEQFDPCTDFCSQDLSTQKTTWLSDELTYYKLVSGKTCDMAPLINDFDVQYAENSCQPDPVNLCAPGLCNLKIHVYYPAGVSIDCKLPAIILFHGGAYNECGDYDDLGIRILGEDLATRGYAVLMLITELE